MEITVPTSLLHDVGLTALAVGGTTLQCWLAFIRPLNKRCENLEQNTSLLGAKLQGELTRVRADSLQLKERLSLFEQAHSEHTDAIGRYVASVDKAGINRAQEMAVKLDGIASYEGQLGQAVNENSARLEQHAGILGKIVSRLEAAPMAPPTAAASMAILPEMTEKLASLQEEFQLRRRSREQGLAIPSPIRGELG